MGWDRIAERAGGRGRIGWWLFIAVLGAAAAYIAYSFIGVLTLGVFGYYATRPIYRRLDALLGRDGLAAALTIVFLIGPIILLALYAGFQAFQQIQGLVASNSGGLAGLVRDSFGLGQLSGEQRRTVLSVLQDPSQLVNQPGQVAQTALGVGFQALSAILGAMVLISLALTLAYFLLEREEGLSAALVELFGGRDTAAYAYASLVDEDLESVFFGNLLFVLAMSIVAAAAYWTTNLLTPPAMDVPMVFTLAFLTGVSSLVPLVVGKLIYLPVTAYLAIQAVRTDGSLALVGGALVGYFLVLDILPQTFLQPYITGRQIDMVMLLFAYILGPMLFGWYGFFLLPIVFIVMLEAIRVVLPELIHGDRLTPDVSLGRGVGQSARSARDDVPDADDAESDAG